MNRTFATIAAIPMLLLLGAASGSAQINPAPLLLHPLRFSLSPRPVQSDSEQLRLLPRILAGGLQCPMPVAVPDTASLERMPVVRVDTTGMAIRVVRPGCVNPLGPSTRSLKPPERPQHP